MLLFYRSLVQIKSHAQKVLKRQGEGENIFRRLDENADRLEELLADNDNSGAQLQPTTTTPSSLSSRSKGKPASGKKMTASASSTALSVASVAAIKSNKRKQPEGANDLAGSSPVQQHPTPRHHSAMMWIAYPHPLGPHYYAPSPAYHPNPSHLQHAVALAAPEHAVISAAPAAAVVLSQTATEPSPTHKKSKHGPQEDFIAASALCQLAGPTVDEPAPATVAGLQE